MSISLIGTTAGRYKIEVQPVEKWAAAGNYQIHLENLRRASPQDEKRFAVESKVAEGRSKQFVDTDDSRRAAISSYENAVTLWRELGDVVQEANTLQFIAETYKALGEFGKCIESYTQALNLRGEEDKDGKANTLLALADAYLEARNSTDALTRYKQALEIFIATNNRRGQAAAHYGLGLTRARMSRMTEALADYRQALEIYTDPQTRDQHEEARTVHAMGGALDVMGEPEEALKFFQRALAGWQETGDWGQEGNTYSSLAKLEMDRGNWQLAFDTYDKVLDLYKRAELSSPRDMPAIRKRHASTLYGISYTYAALADYAKAFEVLEQSLSLRKPGAKGSTLMLLGYFHALAGDAPKALEFCEKALLEQEPTGDPRRSETYTAMGVAQAVMNKHEQALVLYDKALAIQTNQQTRAELAEAITQGWRGESLAALGMHEAALNSYLRSRDLFAKYKDINGVAVALIGMARSERARNHLDTALGYVTEAIAAIEPLRSAVTSEQLRSSYFATKVDYYELYIDLSMQLAAKAGAANLTAAAFEASERARARNLLETLARARIEGQLKVDQALAALVGKYRRVNRQLQSAQSAKYQGKKEGIGEASRFEAERAQIESQLRAEYPDYAALMYPQPLTVAQVQKLLDPDTLLLEFALGEERSYVWEVTATELHGHALPPRAQIEETVRQLLVKLKSGQPVAGESLNERKARMTKAEAEYWSQATVFSRTLLGQTSLLKKKKNLVIVADGHLQYLPFTILLSPDSISDTGAVANAALLTNHQITNLPSASVLGLLREGPVREAPSKAVAIFADPVFEKDDPRIQHSHQDRARPVIENRSILRQAWRDVTVAGENVNLQRLPASRREAQQIINLLPAGSSLEALGFKANREMATSKELTLYRAVHFATHGILDEVNPERSGIVLSLYDEKGRFHEEGYLRLKDIYELNLPVELVVLSACRTGLGKTVKGEGVIGLARGFMYAGTRRVLASVWKVDDDATAELMKRFYQKMLKEDMTPAAALRATQSSMSSSGSQWSHPYFWAGFILQGEPR